MSRLMTKPTKWLYAQRRLRSAWASTQSEQSSLCAQWVAKDPSFLHADSEDPDQTWRMPKLIWIFAGRTGHFFFLFFFFCATAHISVCKLLKPIRRELMEKLRALPGSFVRGEKGFVFYEALLSPLRPMAEPVLIMDAITRYILATLFWSDPGFCKVSNCSSA